MALGSRRARRVTALLLVCASATGCGPAAVSLSCGDDAAKTASRGDEVGRSFEGVGGGASELGRGIDVPRTTPGLLDTTGAKVKLEELLEDPVFQEIGCGMVDYAIEYLPGRPTVEQLVEFGLEQLGGQFHQYDMRQAGESLVKVTEGDLRELDDVICARAGY
jgi:hypothetical protein